MGGAEHDGISKRDVSVDDPDVPDFDRARRPGTFLLTRLALHQRIEIPSAVGLLRRDDARPREADAPDDDTALQEKIRIYDRGVTMRPYYDNYGEFQYAYRYGDINTDCDRNSDINAYGYRDSNGHLNADSDRDINAYGYGYGYRDSNGHLDANGDRHLNADGYSYGCTNCDRYRHSHGGAYRYGYSHSYGYRNSHGNSHGGAAPCSADKPLHSSPSSDG
jgi:hypothetical protein